MEALGINLFSLIVYVVLFFIIYRLLKKYLLPGLSKSISERQKLIADNISLQKKLEEEEANLEKENKAFQQKLVKANKIKEQELIDKANKEAEAIITTAKNKSKIVLEDAQTAAKLAEDKLNKQFDERVAKKAAALLQELDKDNKLNLDNIKISQALNKIK